MTALTQEMVSKPTASLPKVELRAQLNCQCHCRPPPKGLPEQFCSLGPKASRLLPPPDIDRDSLYVTVPNDRPQRQNRTLKAAWPLIAR